MLLLAFLYNTNLLDPYRTPQNRIQAQGPAGDQQWSVSHNFFTFQEYKVVTIHEFKDPEEENCIGT